MVRIEMRDAIIKLLTELEALGVENVSRTKLMKLLYLVDRECKRLYGTQCIKDADWIMWLYGPFSIKVLETLGELEEEGIIECREVSSLDSDYVVFLYKIVKRVNIIVPRGIAEIIRDVASKYGKLPLEKLLKHVYDLPEVKRSRLGDKIP